MNYASFFYFIATTQFFKIFTPTLQMPVKWAFAGFYFFGENEIFLIKTLDNDVIVMYNIIEDDENVNNKREE